MSSSARKETLTNRHTIPLIAVGLVHICCIVGINTRGPITPLLTINLRSADISLCFDFMIRKAQFVHYLQLARLVELDREKRRSFVAIFLSRGLSSSLYRFKYEMRT